MQRAAVCVLVRDAGGRVLSISRPDDRDDVGLIGGSIEPEDGDLHHDRDATLRRAAARELREEAGVALAPEAFAPVFEALVGATRVTTFAVRGPFPFDAVALGRNEEGHVGWATPEAVCAGRYGAYNRSLLDALAPPRDP